MNLTRTGRVPTLLGALLLAGGAWAPAAEAADTLSILSVTPSSGPVPIVPGGYAATPGSLTPSNHIVARLSFPTGHLVITCPELVSPKPTVRAVKP